ncbi:MAG: CRISPR system precrRNA processing endoribonuclease RAMP protein Cas6 [Nitrospirae bacterium]|nr:MAG: CRISPR system precrRNA processing endoribonuclease RAMP protein Cas6 [Nitrospirota bacterium]
MTIKYSLFKLNIRPIDVLNLPTYKGSTLRGAFGVAFKRVACALRRQSCDDCLLSTRCVYSFVFETKPEREVSYFGKIRSIPRPYLIEPPLDSKTQYTPDETLSFNLLLIGKATEYLPYFIYAFQELGNSGIGRGRGKFRLENVVDIASEEHQVIFDCSSGVLKPSVTLDINLQRPIAEVIEHRAFEKTIPEVEFQFLTPTRIKYQRHLVSVPEFHVLIRQTLRRLFLLWYFHCSSGTDDVDKLKNYHRELINRALTVKTKGHSLFWNDWERYSHRQRTKMSLGGFLGEITFLDVPEIFIPFLRAGELLHIGKGTTFGLGKFVLKPF